MNTPLTFRLAAAAASVVITFSLLSGIATMAKPRVADVQLAQAAATIVR
jgi:hypothetical protein